MYIEQQNLGANIDALLNFRNDETEVYVGSGTEALRNLRRHRIWQVEKWLHHLPISMKELEQQSPIVITRLQNQYWLDKWVNKIFEDFRLLAEHVNTIIGGNFFIWH